MPKPTMFLLSLLTILPVQAQSLGSSYGQGKSGDRQPVVANMASTYVPIESWIYPALERLASAGYIQTAFVGLRPWTRMDCARLLAEAEELQMDSDADEQTAQVKLLMKYLTREFAVELRRRDGERNQEARIESINFRNTGIIGAPITDGFHSAQTIVNDYGRPYGEGNNIYTGAALRATEGSFAAYLHAELQVVATAPATPSSADPAIAAADFTPSAAFGPASGFVRGRVLEAYVALAFRNNQLTFGRQALWWGPSKGGPFLFSNNAEPLLMLRYDRVAPFAIPSIGKWLGPIRIQAFIGRLTGQQFVRVGSQIFGQPGVALSDQPFIHGEKVSFKPTPNLEFSVSRTAIFGGNGAPVTFSSVMRSYFSVGNTVGKDDPGDRRSAVDAQYRIPKLRNWLTAYVDTFTDDEPFPLNYPTESAWLPGLYLSHLPGVSRMDFRAEGYLTPKRDLFPGFYYFNVHYLSGYTNARQLMGSWIGREANGLQLWTTWWFSPNSSLQASFRHVSASPEFLSGGNLRDISLTANIVFRPDWQLRAAVQTERWRFPLYSNNAMNNLTASVELTYWPAAKEF
jgi:Capsule assembly protein Wzi